MSGETLAKVEGSATAAMGEVLDPQVVSARGDSWVNERLQIGSARDPSVYTRFTSRGGGLDDGTLEAMYIEDHWAARIVELVVAHAMRKGWDLRLDIPPEQATAGRLAYARAEEELDVAGEMRKGAIWGRLFGGAVTWIGIDDGEGESTLIERLASPITKETTVKSVLFLHTFDRREVAIEESYGPGPKFRQPKSYKITAATPVGRVAGTTLEQQLLAAYAGGVVVHESRLLVWPGAPTTMKRRNERSGWDDSVLERAWDALRQTGEDYGAKSQLLSRISQFVFKVKGLASLLLGDERKFTRRMGLLDASRSRGKALAIDVDESVENITQPVSGIDTLIDKSVDRSGVAGGVMPGVFVGRPTAEDRDAWDDEVETWQNDVLKPRHERVAALILRAADGPVAGKEPASWSITYRALRTPKPKERAELRKLQAETDGIEVDKGIIPPEAVALHRHTLNALGEGDVMLDAAEVSAALNRRRELANKPPKDNAELGTVSARAGGGVLEVLTKYNRGEITRGQAKRLLVLTFTLTEDDAEGQLDSVAEIAKLPPAPAPGGKPGPAPQPAKGTGAGAPQGLPGFDDGGDPTSKKLPPDGSPG